MELPVAAQWFLGLASVVDSLPLPDSWFDTVLGQRGALALLLLLLVALVRQWLVPGPLYRQLIEERNEWKQIALKGLGKGEELVQLVEEQ